MSAAMIRIEPAGPAEAAEVIELIHRVFDEYGFIWDPEEEFWDLMGDDFPYLEPRGAIWVGRDAEGRIVGSIAAELVEGGAAAEFHRLYLDAQRRGARAAADAGGDRLGAAGGLRAGGALVRHAL